MYRVEIVEITEKYGEIERISSPCENELDIINETLYLKKQYEKELKSEKWFIKVVYVNINEVVE